MSTRGGRARARTVPALGARVVSRTPLFYRGGADASLDRPAHVRAGSALARLGPKTYAVVQDDASFLAVLEGVGESGRELVVRDVALPSSDGIRQFDEDRGNKRLKLDLEASVVFDHGALLVAFGSGSTTSRERIALVERPATSDARAVVVEAEALYAAMRSEASFCGSELNVEGATIVGDDVVFLQRGNGAPVGERTAVDASARVDRRQLLAYLRGLALGDLPRSELSPCPPLREVLTWDLGEIGGTRLTFTDAAGGQDGWTRFVACAEASPDATRDGPVRGVAIGRLDDRARIAELAPVLDEHDNPLTDKAEGIAFGDSIEDAHRAWLVVDRDDPRAPAELLELRLGDGWT